MTDGTPRSARFPGLAAVISLQYIFPSQLMEMALPGRRPAP